MRRRSWIAVSLLLTAMAISLYLMWPREPSYNGRPLSTWLAALDDGEAQKGITWSADPPKEPSRTQLEAAEAIRHLGTNALPTLTRTLRAREATSHILKEIGKQWLVRFHLAKQSFQYERRTPTTTIRHRAALGLIALDPTAKPAVSELAALFNETEFCKESALVLASMGPSGLAPLQSFIRTNPPSWQAVCAIWALGQFPNNAQPIVPDILSGLTNKNVGFKNASVWALTRIQIDPDTAVQALTNAAGDQGIRYLCLKAIAHYGARATSAVPFLIDALYGPRRPDHHDVLETLKTIDPEAAERTARGR